MKNALSSSRCRASAITVNTELDDFQTDSLDFSAKESGEDCELICPNEGCKHKKPYSKKTNLLRHYRSRTFTVFPLYFALFLENANLVLLDVECNAICICKTSHSTVDEYARHTRACDAMQGAHLKSSKTTQAQWRVIELRDDLLERARQQLDSQLAVTAKLPCLGTDLADDRKNDACYTHQQLASPELSKFASRNQKAKRSQLEYPPPNLQPPRNKRPRRSSVALSFPSVSSISKPETRKRLPSGSGTEAPENHADGMLGPGRNAIGMIDFSSITL